MGLSTLPDLLIFFGYLPSPFVCVCIFFPPSTEQLLAIACAGINNDLLNRIDLK